MRFRILAFSCALFTGGLLAVRPVGEAAQRAAPARTLFEGARLIAGDGRAPIESSAILVENDRFTQVKARFRCRGARRA